MKKIGFIDYYISEWHANNYPKWIAAAAEALGVDYKVAYVWAELDRSPIDGVSTSEWCEKYGAEQCASIAELCEKSDAVIILAPSDPDRHLGYAREALPFARRIYIDKTFAPDTATALEIIACAEAHATPFFSSSALRFAEEFEGLGELSSLTVTGGGSNLPEYSVHLCEIAVRLFGRAPGRVCASRSERGLELALDFGGASATLVYDPNLGYSIDAKGADGSEKVCKLESHFFRAMMRAILKFFEDGVLPFERSQTVDVMRLRDAVLAAADNLGERVKVM